ncbi:MAG: hypothetical protein Q4P33_08720 [Flaviflexus sp.]|nr:hypothetical protein [Flaviflexus sp.]
MKLLPPHAKRRFPRKHTPYGARAPPHQRPSSPASSAPTASTHHLRQRRPLAPIPLDTDLITCVHDSDVVTDSARLVFDPEKELLHHVNYVFSTMDVTAKGTTPGTAENLKYHVVWDF